MRFLSEKYLYDPKKDQIFPQSPLRIKDPLEQSIALAGGFSSGIQPVNNGAAILAPGTGIRPFNAKQTALEAAMNRKDFKEALKIISTIPDKASRQSFRMLVKLFKSFK